MSDERDWAATPDATDPSEATKALDAEGSSPDRVQPDGVGSTHHDFGDYDLGGGRMVSDQYREPTTCYDAHPHEHAVLAPETTHLMFRHTPEEAPATTKRSFTVVRMWRVEADTVMQALDATPRDLDPDEIHVSQGSPDDLYDWLRQDRSRCESCGNIHDASQACT